MIILEIGNQTRLGKYIWRVERIDGNYVWLSWGERKKVVPLGTAEAGKVDVTPKPAVRSATRTKPIDAISQALSECKTWLDLADVAGRHFNFMLNVDQALTLSRLPNFGMQRMYVANILRRRIAKKK